MVSIYLLGVHRGSIKLTNRNLVCYVAIVNHKVIAMASIQSARPTTSPSPSLHRRAPSGALRRFRRQNMSIPSIAVSKATAIGKPPAPPTDVTLILFGRDGGGRPHAAWFDAADEALARKAAATMGLHALQAAAEADRALAAGLAKGRVFASGKGFVPFTNETRYAALAEAAGVAPGDAVKKPKKASPVSAGLAGAPDQGAKADLPKDWQSIKVGSLALASEGVGHGWYEVLITEDRGDGLFVVVWRDSPDLAPFPRRREHLALLHPDFVAE